MSRDRVKIQSLVYGKRGRIPTAKPERGAVHETLDFAPEDPFSILVGRRASGGGEAYFLLLMSYERVATFASQKVIKRYCASIRPGLRAIPGEFSLRVCHVAGLTELNDVVGAFSGEGSGGLDTYILTQTGHFFLEVPKNERLKALFGEGRDPFSRSN